MYILSKARHTFLHLGKLDSIPVLCLEVILNSKVNKESTKMQSTWHQVDCGKEICL